MSIAQHADACPVAKAYRKSLNEIQDTQEKIRQSKEIKPCIDDVLHHGLVRFKVTVDDRELAERFGVGTMITPTLLCITHNVLHGYVRYDAEGWKSCQCHECSHRRETVRKNRSSMPVSKITTLRKRLERPVSVPEKDRETLLRELGEVKA